MFFFDVGDTLAERAVDEVTAAVTALDRLGAGGGPEERRLALTAMAHAYRTGVYAPASPSGESRLWRTVATVGLDRLPVGPHPERVEAFAGAIGRYFDLYRPMAGMPDLIADLRGAGAAVGIISNWPPSLPAFLSHLGYGAFPVLACSGALRCCKPDPEIFRWALEHAGVDAARCWHVGNDPDHDYAPAAALGIRAVLWDPAGRFAGTGVRRAGTAAELRVVLGMAT